MLVFRPVAKSVVKTQHSARLYGLPHKQPFTAPHHAGLLNEHHAGLVGVRKLRTRSDKFVSGQLPFVQSPLWFTEYWHFYILCLAS